MGFHESKMSGAYKPFGLSAFNGLPPCGGKGREQAPLNVITHLELAFSFSYNGLALF